MIVFSLNTLIGFACSVGLDKLFTSHHKDEAVATSVHVHADGKKHDHHKKETIIAKVHIHSDGKKHVHNEKSDKKNADVLDNTIANNDAQPKESKDNCCTTKVSTFEQTDKCVPENVKVLPVFFAANLPEFYNIDVLYTSYINTSIRYFVRSYHPPIPNIRLAIRSFQI